MKTLIAFPLLVSLTSISLTSIAQMEIKAQRAELSLEQTQLLNKNIESYDVFSFSISELNAFVKSTSGNKKLIFQIK